jgi:hypothetical protein
MARTSIAIDTSLGHAWTRLQLLSTWEGIAGIEDLDNADHDASGNLKAFRFAMDTALGRVSGRAKVRSQRPSMLIRAEQKGLAITLHVSLIALGATARADVEASAKATSFLSSPLAIPLNALLDTSIDREAETIAQRVTTP